jgi:hypothetical protein
MKVRAITLFVRCATFDAVESNVRAAAASADALKAYFIDRGYEVQTTRIAMNSFEEWLTEKDPLESAKELVALLDELQV